MQLDYDIVIVSRNRPEALKMSIPLLFSQTRRAARLVVVDSSDNHESVREVMEKLSEKAPFPVEVIHSEKGMTRQRSVGLERVQSPIVFYPDDDSLFFPNTAEEMMRIYERDAEEAVGGVCARPSLISPLDGKPQYRMSFRDQIKTWMGSVVPKINNFLAPDPFGVHGKYAVAKFQPPNWLSEENAVTVEWMVGFRMSFRTNVIQKVGFEQAFTSYGGFEDVSVSFRILEKKLLIGARNAKIFHHKFPSRRSHGVGMGMRQILNKAYIVCRYSPPGSHARTILPRFVRFRLLQYLMSAHTRFGRERILGAWRAARCVRDLDRCQPDKLLEEYVKLRKRCLIGYDDV